MASFLGDPSHLLPAGWTDVVQKWFQEDAPSMDYGGFVVGDTPESATLFGKSKVPETVLRLTGLGSVGWSALLR